MQQDQLPLEEALVEPSVVRNEERIARKAEEAAKNAGDGSRALQFLLTQSWKAGRSNSAVASTCSPSGDSVGFVIRKNASSVISTETE